MATPDTSLTPDELDRLEDALERWTEEGFEPGPEDSLLAAPLRERLDGYREVLHATREALPPVDVGDDVLAAVLAEARRADAKPRGAASGPGLWERLRRSMLLPGVALAGSAALLLYLVQPSEQLSLDAPSTDETPTKREEARLAPEPGPAPAAPSPADLTAPGAVAPAAAQIAADEVKDEKRAIEAESAAGAAVPKDMDAKMERPAKSKTMRSSKEDGPSAEPLPGLDDGPPSEAADKEELRDILESADAARRHGDCKSAQTGYLRAMDMDGALIERAQARAGYGLCLQQGDEATAQLYFDKARKLYPGIDGWLAREGEGKKSVKKPMPSPPAKPKKLAEPLK